MAMSNFIADIILSFGYRILSQLFVRFPFEHFEGISHSIKSQSYKLIGCDFFQLAGGELMAGGNPLGGRGATQRTQMAIICAAPRISTADFRKQTSKKCRCGEGNK